MLLKGDKIGIVACSNAQLLSNKEKINELEKVLKDIGLNPIFSKFIYEKYSVFSGSGKERGEALMNFYLDKDIKAIFDISGGDLANEVLDYLDFEIIKNNPKFFVGFSDITGLHIAFNKYADLVTFHGVMAGTSPKWDEFTYNSLINALNNNVTKFENPNDEPIYTVVKGQCEGELIGGNLALIAAGIGTKYEIDTKDKILFIEDVGEAIYRAIFL